MKQVLNIFKKDVRHYWHEIVVSIALLAAFARYDVRSWANEGLGGTRTRRAVSFSTAGFYPDW